MLVTTTQAQCKSKGSVKEKVWCQEELGCCQKEGVVSEGKGDGVKRESVVSRGKGGMVSGMHS